MQSSILNKNVSFYKSLSDKKGIVCNLQILLAIDAYQPKVEVMRQTLDPERKNILKRSLPCFTPSGSFSVRNVNGLLEHSGLIQFDIDFKDNAHISNYENLKDEISKIKNVAYVGRSVSGKGYWGIVPISFPKQHKEHFSFLADSFLKQGIVLDLSGSDVTRLRILSYDPDAYFNHDAEPLSQFNFNQTSTPVTDRTEFSEGLSKCVLEALLKVIDTARIDITEGYHNWFRIGCFFAGLPNGLAHYQAISRYHPQYSSTETELQFLRCQNYPGYKMGTLIHICRMRGITVTGKFVSIGNVLEVIT